MTAFSVANDRAAIRAAGRALFEGRVGEEAVVVDVNDAVVVVRSERATIIRAPPGNICVENTEPLGGAVVLRTRQGQAVVINVTEKRVSAGRKLTVEQTRDLLVEAIDVFGEKK
jgi:hypothetical protein